MNVKNTDDEIFLIDGSGFIFRAYYAMPQNLTNLKGEPVGAVMGFCNMLVKLTRDFHAGRIAVIFDAARKNFRYDIYADYKANRSETPPDLVPQFPYFRLAAEAFGIPALELEGYEADDLIAAYAKQARASGKNVTIVGSDKDLYQLIREGVRLYDPMKQKYITPDDITEKFGVPADKVTEVQALSGDSTDNIPGAPGIGPKTAAELIQNFGDIETLIARAEEIKQPKRREAILANADKIRMSKKLVLLDETAPVPMPLEDLKAHDPDTPHLSAFLKEMGFKSLLARLGLDSKQPFAPRDIPVSAPLSQPLIASQPPSRHDAFPPIADNIYTLINDEDTLKAWAAKAFEAGILCIDTETTALTPAKARLVGVSLCVKPGQAAYIPIGHRTGSDDLFGENTGTHAAIPQLGIAKVISILKPILEDSSVIKIGHNIKYDWQMLAQHGIETAPCDDTMLLSYVLDGSAHPHGMDSLSQRYLNHKPIAYEDVAGKGKAQISFDRVPIETALQYAAEDADITLRLYHILKPRLALEKMTAVYENIECPLIPVIARMERAGIAIDPAMLRALSQDFAVNLARLEGEIHSLAGQPFNVASPKQTGDILFGVLGLTGGKKTKTGDWSTAASVLDDLADQGHPIAQKMLEHRQLAKLKSTYADALVEQINPATGRVHTSFAMAHTNTGRLSSSDPNLQNIPVRTEEGRKIRAAFIAAPGHVLVSADYSQVELRLAAALGNIAALKQAFHDGTDIHTLTASQVFGVALADVTGELRRAAKAVNFGIIYGISGFGLAKQLGCSQSEASDFIRKYLARFRELQDYMEARKAEARQFGYVKTFHGRKCVIAGINEKNAAQRNFAERQAINAPLQGTAADIMKIAMINVEAALLPGGFKTRMLLQVHDELVLEAPEDEARAAAALVTSTMQAAADVGVPLVAEYTIGKSWKK